jgi:hypothetical protein
MKYIAQGTVFFDDFVQQLNKFNINDIVLEIKVNFLSGVLVAERFLTVRGIDTIKRKNLCMNLIILKSFIKIKILSTKTL